MSVMKSLLPLALYLFELLFPVEMSSNFQLESYTTMYDLFKNQQLTDVKFLCSNGEIGAHLLVLKANSKWFQDNNNLSVIVLLEYSKLIVTNFLTLLYVGSGSFSDNESLQKLLDLFQCTCVIKDLSRINNEVSVSYDTHINVLIKILIILLEI